MALFCRTCGSDEISQQNEGFNYTKAVIGDALVGPLFGIFLGGRKQHRIILTCLNCGYSWKAGKDKRRNVQRQITAATSRPTIESESTALVTVGGLPSPAAANSEGEDRPHPVRTVFLWLGIFLMPYLFSWFTLREKHGAAARVIALGWMMLCGAAVAYSVTHPTPPTPTPPPLQPSPPSVLTRAPAKPAPADLPSTSRTPVDDRTAGPVQQPVADTTSSELAEDLSNYSATYRECLSTGDATLSTRYECVSAELTAQDEKLKVEYAKVLYSVGFAERAHFRDAQEDWKSHLPEECGAKPQVDATMAVKLSRDRCSLKAVTARRMQLERTYRY